MDVFNESWWSLLVIIGILTVLVFALWWALKRFRRTYRWYLTRGDDEEKMEEELEMKETLLEQYLDTDENSTPKT